MATQGRRELAQQLVIHGRGRLSAKSSGALAQRLADQHDGAQPVAQEADHGIVERRHALLDITLLHLVDRAPAEPQQGRCQRHHDECHQRQDVDAERNRAAASGHVIPPRPLKSGTRASPEGACCRSHACTNSAQHDPSPHPAPLDPEHSISLRNGATVGGSNDHDHPQHRHRHRRRQRHACITAPRSPSTATASPRSARRGGAGALSPAEPIDGRGKMRDAGLRQYPHPSRP